MNRPTALPVAVDRPLNWKQVLTSWPVVGIGSTAVAQLLQDPLLQQLCALYWICVAGILLIHKYKPFFQKNRPAIALYYFALVGLYGLPANAQASATCNTKGLFSAITNFVATTFGNIKFTGSVTSLDGTICQVVGFLVFIVVLSFIGVAMYVAFQVNFQQQPLTVALNPLMGFLIFAAISTIVISVMLGV